MYDRQASLHVFRRFTHRRAWARPIANSARGEAAARIKIQGARETFLRNGTARQMDSNWYARNWCWERVCCRKHLHDATAAVPHPRCVDSCGIAPSDVFRRTETFAIRHHVDPMQRCVVAKLDTSARCGDCHYLVGVRAAACLYSAHESSHTGHKPAPPLRCWAREGVRIVHLDGSDTFIHRGFGVAVRSAADSGKARGYKLC
jgi:hypothetical protein